MGDDIVVSPKPFKLLPRNLLHTLTKASPSVFGYFQVFENYIFENN